MPRARLWPPPGCKPLGASKAVTWCKFVRLPMDAWTGSKVRAKTAVWGILRKPRFLLDTTLISRPMVVLRSLEPVLGNILNRSDCRLSRSERRHRPQPPSSGSQLRRRRLTPQPRVAQRTLGMAKTQHKPQRGFTDAGRGLRYRIGCMPRRPANTIGLVKRLRRT